MLAACGRLDFAPQLDAGLPSSSPDGGALAHRIRLDLDRYTPTATVTDLALLVVLDASRFPRDLARADLADLRFEMDGATLAHEIEQLDPTPILWVQVPALSGSPIYLYFGGDPVPATAPVWSPSYVGVWHLDDGHDASPNHNSGDLVQTTTVAGVIGQAIDVAGAGYVAIAPSGSTAWASGAVTVTGWIRARSFPTGPFATLVGRENGGGGADDFAIGYATDGTVTSDLVTTNDFDIPSTKITLATWVHLGLTYDGVDMTQFQDGAPRTGIPVTGAVAQSVNPIFFGADSESLPQSPDNEYVDGQLDEIRIENIARTPAWIAADHASQTDAWITYGAVETGPF